MSTEKPLTSSESNEIMTPKNNFCETVNEEASNHIMFLKPKNGTEITILPKNPKQYFRGKNGFLSLYHYGSAIARNNVLFWPLLCLTTAMLF